MGSSGTGRLTDYSGFFGGQKPSPSKGMQGPSGPIDRCALAFSTELEDVLTSEYYTKLKTIPAKGEHITIAIKYRIVVIANNGLVVGNLPTRYNYLYECINDGFVYQGVVEESEAGILPLVIVAVTPSKS